MGGGLESRCVGRVYGADGVVHGTAPSAQNSYKTQTSMRPAGFKPAIPLSEPPQTHILDRTAVEFHKAFLFLMRVQY